jgi:hypothetical protein
MRQLLCFFVLLMSFSAYAENEPVVLKVDGVGHMRMDTVAATLTTGTVPAMCFDVDLIDMSTGLKIGSATDCLSEIVEHELDNGMAVVATTTFTLPDGSATVRTLVSVQPVSDSEDFIDSSGRMYTHMSGAIGDRSAVIDSTGSLQGISGTGRLSGLLDMSHFNEQEGDIIIFNCLFEIYLD